MDPEPDGVDDAGSRAPGVGESRRLIVAGVAGGVVLLLVVAVLATLLASTPGTPKAAPTPGPTPTPTATLTVPDIYQRVAPSVVTIRNGDDLGTGLIVADNGTILTADHVVASGGSVTVTFADGTVANATVTSADKQMDIAVLSPAKLPQVVVPATLGGGAGIGRRDRQPARPDRQRFLRHRLRA
jgi:putative serine protease PepD